MFFHGLPELLALNGVDSCNLSFRILQPFPIVEPIRKKATFVQLVSGLPWLRTKDKTFKQQETFWKHIISVLGLPWLQVLNNIFGCNMCFHMGQRFPIVEPYKKRATFVEYVIIPDVYEKKEKHEKNAWQGGEKSLSSFSKMAKNI